MADPTETMTQEGQVEVLKETTTSEQAVESTQETKPTDDLLTRVSKFELNNDPKKESGDNGGVFNSKELDDSIAAIDNPELKSKMEGMRKSLLSGANDKFQEIATLRKEMQSVLESKKDVWTPERVQALANDPKFIEAAQSIAAPENADEYSSLSDTEKDNMKTMQTEISNLKNQYANALKTSQQQLRETQHIELSGKYANYDKQEIDTITYEMLEGKIKATPEHIYKAFRHDDNVKRAYELGRKDEREGVEEKVQSTSVEGITTTSSKEEIVAEKGESNRYFLDNIIKKNLRLVKTKS